MKKISKIDKSWFVLVPYIMVLYVGFVTYGYFYSGSFSFVTLSESLAGTGGVLIGVSFLMSSLTYYFDIVDRHFGLRKHLGVYGYFFALFYAFTLQVRFPEKYYAGLADNLYSAEVILGLFAMGILTFMTLISNRYGVKLLGPYWRRALRLGYLAYLALIVRAVIVEQSIWLTWLSDMSSSLPPPRLLLTIFACFVILCRLSLEISLRKEKNRK